MTLIEVIHKKIPQLQNLRMKDIVVHKRERLVNLVVSYPEKIDNEMQDKLLQLCQDEVGTAYTVNISFQPDQMTVESAKKHFFDYVKKVAFVLLSLKETDVEVQKSDRSFVFTLHLTPMLIDIVKAGGYITQFQNEMAEKTCYSFSFKIAEKDDNKSVAKAKEAMTANLQLSLSKELLKPRRYMQIDSVRALFGSVVKIKPKYICDANEACQSYTLCGTIVSKKVFASQRQSAQKMDVCKLELKDDSGKINAVYFAKYQVEDAEIIMQMKGKNLDEAKELVEKHKKANERIKEKLMRLAEGDQVVVTGKIQFSDYSKTFEMVINQLSKCRIISSLPPSDLIKPVPQNYEKIKPQLISTNRQMSFVEEETVVPDQFKGDLIVLYLTTTGDKILQDKILQIGAIKLVNGARRQAFFALVNCQKDIDEQFLRDVGETKFRYDRSYNYLDIVGDLYKFCYNTRIATTNCQKVTAFLQYNSTAFGYHFDNQFVELSQLFDDYYNHNADKKKPDCTDLEAVAKAQGVSSGKNQSAYAKAELASKILSAMCQ